MNSTKISNADRAGVIRESWNRAYLAAVLAVEPVRQHISAAMRSAWIDFRQARAEGMVLERMTQTFEDQHARAGRAEARAYLKGLLAAKAEAAPVQVEVAEVDAVPELVDEAPEEAQLSLLKWIVADAIRAGEPGLYTVDQVEPVAPAMVVAPARPAPVEPKPVQLSILDLIDADVLQATGIPEALVPDQDDEDALDAVVIEEVVDPRQELLDRIARNDAAMDRLSESIKQDIALYGSDASHIEWMYDSLDGLHAHGINLRDDLNELGHQPVPMVPQAAPPASFLHHIR